MKAVTQRWEPIQFASESVLKHIAFKDENQGNQYFLSENDYYEGGN